MIEKISLNVCLTIIKNNMKNFYMRQIEDEFTFTTVF